MPLHREKSEVRMEALHLLQCKQASGGFGGLTGFGVSGMKTVMKRAIVISIIICG